MKYPWIQFFTGDWLKDPALSICSPATRGIWIDLLCAMHELDRAGQLRGTYEQLARVARCLPADVAHALTELQATEAADVTERNGVVTVINRRMKNEANERNGNRLRKRRQRGSQDCHAPVAPHISESESESEYREGGEPPPACSEVPTLEQAIAETAVAGILPEFARYVFQDWSSRSGKDGGGNVVPWLPYVTKRWAREQVEWKAGTHRGKKSVESKPARVAGVPTRGDVLAYALQKWGDDTRYTNWATSFHTHWSDAKRNWNRNGKLIDWKIALSEQVSKWRTEK